MTNRSITQNVISIIIAILASFSLCYCITKQFYFYQVVVVGIILSPITLFLIRSPRGSLLALLVLTIPFNPAFHVVRVTSHAFHVGLMFYTSDVIVLVIFVYLLIESGLHNRKKHKNNTKMRRFVLPLLLWIIAGALSIVPAGNKNIAVIELIRMVRVLLVFVAVYHLIDKPDDLRVVAASLVVAFAVQTALVHFEYSTEYRLMRLPGGAREADVIEGLGVRPGGTMGHSGNFAKLASLCLPICLAFACVASSNWGKLAAATLTVLGLIALVLTISRAGVAASITGLCWVLWWLWRRTSGHAAMKSAAVVLVVTAGGFAWYMGASRLISRVREDYSSAISRPQMYAVAYNIIKSHPLAGVGLNNYHLVAPDYDRTPEKISIIIPGPVHNIYMLHAAEIGIPGALCFIWFLIATIAMTFKRSSESRFLLDSAIMKAMGIGTTCSWLQGLIGHGHRSSIVHMSYLAVFAGAFAALSYYNRNHSVDYDNGR